MPKAVYSLVSATMLSAWSNFRFVLVVCYFRRLLYSYESCVLDKLEVGTTYDVSVDNTVVRASKLRVLRAIGYDGL